MMFWLLQSCASDIKISPRDDTGLLFGFELSPSSYDPVEVPVNTEYNFEFLLVAHKKTTIQDIFFLSSENTELWSLDILLDPPITLSANSEMKLSVYITPNQMEIYEQEVQITSTREDWNVNLEVVGVAP